MRQINDKVQTLIDKIVAGITIGTGTKNIGKVDVNSSALPTGAATEVKQDSVITELTAIKATAGIKKIVDALPAGTNNIGDVDVASSVLPTGAATETKQDTIIGHVDGLEGLLTAIKDTDGIKKITDAIPAGSNVIGQVGIDQTTDGTTNKIQARNTTHDNFQVNANIQLTDTDVSNANPVPVSDAGSSITVDGNVGISGNYTTGTAVGDDNAVVFENSAAANTQVNVDIAKPSNPKNRYLLTVYNPSTITDLTVRIFAKDLALGGDIRYSHLDTIAIQKSQAFNGLTINSYSYLLEGAFIGTDLRIVIMNDAALGAADGFSAYIRVREVV